MDDSWWVKSILKAMKPLKHEDCVAYLERKIMEWYPDDLAGGGGGDKAHADVTTIQGSEW